MDSSNVKNFTAAGTIAPRRFVAFDAQDGYVKQASGAAGERIAGATLVAGADAGLRVDVCMGGRHAIEAGASFAAGAALTAAADGRAVALAPAAGVVAVGAAVALEASAGAGQLVDVYVRPNPIVG